MPKNADQFIVCNKSSTIYLMTIRGQVRKLFKETYWYLYFLIHLIISLFQITKSFTSEKKTDGDFVSCVVSPQGEFIYCVGEDSNLYCFNVQSGKLVSTLKVISFLHVMSLLFFLN